MSSEWRINAFNMLTDACVKRHCKGNSFMVWQGQIFLLWRLCARIHASALSADVNQLPI